MLTLTVCGNLRFKKKTFYFELNIAFLDTLGMIGKE